MGDGETISVKNAANEVFSKIYDFAYALPIEAYDLKNKILRSIEVQKSKLRDSGLTPSGNILKEMQAKNLGYLAVSLGFYKTLFSAPSLSTSSEIDEKERKKMGLTNSLVRISIGLDHDIERTYIKIKECIKKIKIL